MPVNINKGSMLGMRHVQSVLLFFNVTSIYCSRLNIGVAVVAMTNAATANPDFPEFNWSEKEISYVISSFFWGYVCTQFPGGFLCKKFGAKLVMIVATSISALLSAATPWCVGWGSWRILCVIRIVQGLAQGVIFPCVYEHLAKWVPLKERNRLGAFALSGSDCGTILAMSLSGIIAKGAWGWPGIYYISAGICFSWCIFWLIFGENNPDDSKFIGTKEKSYIASEMALSDDFHKKKIAFPWNAVLRSTPFYVLILARSCQNWGLSTIHAQIPSYLSGVLNMEIKSNGLYSSLPFIAMWIMSYVYLSLADILQNKTNISLTTLRRLFNSLGSWLPALGLVIIGFLDERHKTLAIILMTLIVALNSGNIIGSALNMIDLAPNHAGFMMSLVNAVSNVTPFISPLVVGVVVTDVTNRTLWQIVFIIAAAVLFFGNLFYILFGSAETQPWNAVDFLEKEAGRRKTIHGYDNNIEILQIKVKCFESNDGNLKSENNNVQRI
ncbi:putative inorganic phosphate cotransporter [Musca vetustissima]|uniref:putative inorganic phosphate cotransporter n=1 Tax=Musca vetustissima TaxID=27455 RepID=UPI002AB7EE9A|nr:putative inorganic phosphate cotransporter [Musca vetustissima]